MPWPASRLASPSRVLGAPACDPLVMASTLPSIRSLPSAPVARTAAALFEQPDVLDGDALACRLAHVVDGQRGHRGRGQRFHLDAGRGARPRRGFDAGAL